MVVLILLKCIYNLFAYCMNMRSKASNQLHRSPSLAPLARQRAEVILEEFLMKDGWRSLRPFVSFRFGIDPTHCPDARISPGCELACCRDHRL